MKQPLMKYEKPQLRSLGSLTELTLGQGGSCLDGNGLNITQHGGGLEVGCGENEPG